MRLHRRAPEAPQSSAPAPAKPGWQELLDPQERPNRENLAADHSPFESLLEPVPLPKWLRGKRRVPRDRIS